VTAERSFLVVGAGGMLGSQVLRRRPPGIRVIALDRAALDIADPAAVDAAVEAASPRVVINCAGFTDVDGCESRREHAFRVNGAGPAHLARAAARRGAALLHVSTDYVFDGESDAPYREDDPTAPVNVYGASKLAGERAVLAEGPPERWIVRTSWLYGAGGRHFPGTIARLARERTELTVVDDQRGAPTWTGDLAAALWRIVGAAGTAPCAPGTWHVSGQGECSWYDLAVAVVAELRARGATLAVERIRPVTTADFPRPARRPRRSRLSTEKFERAAGPLRAWRDALSAYFDAEGAAECGLGGRA
jgi:dTDP-4-dehydrorhamnose reductase